MEVLMKTITHVATAIILSFYATCHAGMDHSEFIETQCLTGEDVTRSCLDCHGPDGVMDFKALGYKGDPMTSGWRFAPDK